MKITCQSCQSKYNVADEKVQGKVVKIRCRKCGATIVVNGTAGTTGSTSTEAPDASATESARPADAGDLWHVNIAENDQRSMALGELIDAYNSGVVTHDTFVWMEGMGDWKPLGEVEAILVALHERSSHGSAASEASPKGSHAAASYEAAPAQAAAFAAPASAPYEPPAAFAAAPTSSDMGARQESRRAAVKREGLGRDLFATGLGESNGGQDMQGGVETSAPLMHQATGMAPIDDPSKLTGERNENSVLFSLAVLTKTAEERAPISNSALSSSREDSGLIDLKALALKTESMRPATFADGAIFSAPLGARPPLGAPDAPLGEAQAKSTLPRTIGLVAGIALVLVLGMVIGIKFFGGASAATPVASSSGAPPASAAPEATASAATSATADSSAAAASASVAATTSKPRPNPGAVYHPQAAPAGRPASAAAPAAGGPAAAAPAAAPGRKGDCGCNGDLMCLMKCSTH